MHDTGDVFARLGISLALGLLVGLQREHAEKLIAGLRTFPLVTVLGTLSAFLDQQTDAHGWIIAAAFLGLAALVAVVNVFMLRQAEPAFGLTTEAAILLMFVLGAYLAFGEPIIAVAVAAAVAVLLQFKVELHGIVQRLGNKDVRAIMQFVLFSGVILPILPNQTYDPLGVLNPREIWLMVVLIVGISLGGYLVYKFFGRNAGIALGGILGGAISSTATTVSYSRRAAEAEQTAPLSAVVVMIASSVVFVRVLIEIAVVAPTNFLPLAAPIIVLLGTSLITAVLAWIWVPKIDQQEMPEQRNPTELKSALIFAGLYALVTFALAAVKHSAYIGNRGLYVVALLSGLTDMDAITLSTARMVRNGPEQGGIEIINAWRLIVVAAVANLFFKAGIVAVIGHRQLLWRVALLFSVPVVTGALLLWLWPQQWTAYLTP